MLIYGSQSLTHSVNKDTQKKNTVYSMRVVCRSLNTFSSVSKITNIKESSELVAMY